jgi:hypothetical protein
MALSHSPKIVTDGLVLCLDAGDGKSYSGSGTTWTDRSGNGYDGTLTNGPTFDSANGGSLVFDGVNDYAKVNSVDLSSTNNITVSFWVKVLDSYPTSWKVLVELTNNFNSSTQGFYIGIADNSSSLFQDTLPISLNLKGNVGYNISGFNKDLINDLQWHQLIAVLDKSITGSNPRQTFLYVDGIEQDPSVNPENTYRKANTNSWGDQPFLISCRGGSQAFSNIELNALQIYNKALTASEVLQNYNAQKGRFS